MGMFDELVCHYPLPVAGANDLVYQTKDLDCQMDRYELRADGTLWHEAYETRTEDDPKAFFGFYVIRENQRWEQVRLTGEVRFYQMSSTEDWIEWSAYFKAGALQQVNLIEHGASSDGTDPRPDQGEVKKSAG